MRAASRVLRWTAIALAALAVAGVGLVLVALFTPAGRDRVRVLVERLVTSRMNGTLRLAGLRVTPRCELSLDSVVVRDTDDSLLVATGPVEARCDVAALARGRLELRDVMLTRPRIALRELPSGGWNWAHAFRRDTTPEPGPRPPRTSTALRIRELRLRDGEFVMSSLVGAPASARGRAEGRRVAGGGPAPARDAIDRRRVSGLQLDLADVRVAAPDAAVALRLTRLAGRADRPPLAASDGSGTLRVARDSLWIDVPRVAVGRSTLRGAGVVTWAGPEPTRYDLRLLADTAAFADLAWADSLLPAEGGGRARLRVRTGPGPREVAYEVSDLDASTGGSRVRGRLTLRRAPGQARVRDVALDLTPLRLNLVRQLYGRPLPRGVRGDVEGRLVARGGPLRDLVLDTVALRFRDARVPGAVSQLRLSGRVDASDLSRPHFHGLRVASDGIDARSAALLFPELPRVTGRLAFAATLDSALDDLRVSDARLTYRERGAPPLEVSAAGRVAVRGAQPSVDGAVRFRSLSFAALAPAVPALRGLPVLRGEVVARGTLGDLTIHAELAGGGSVRWDGRIDATAPTFGAWGRASFRRLDLRAATGDSALPRTDLSVDADVGLQGASARTLVGSAELRVNGGRVEGAPILPSLARLRLEPDRVVVDSAVFRSTLAELRAKGVLGRAPTRRDTLELALVADSLGRLLALARGRGPPPADTTAALGGSATATARLVGSLDTLDARGSASVTALAVGALAVARGRVDFDLAGLPRATRGEVRVVLDTARVASLAFDQLAGEARAERPGEWRLAARSGARDVPGFATAGSVTRASAVTTVTLDSLDYHVSGAGLRLAHAASLRMDGSSTVLDTVELHGRRGSRLRVAATLRRDSTIDAFLLADRVPLAALTPTAARAEPAAPPGAATTVSAGARLTGTRAAPVASFGATLRGVSRDSSGLDSLRVGGEYRSERAAVEMGAYADGHALVSANAVVPVRASLAPVAAAMLDAPLTGRVVLDGVALRDVASAVAAFPATAGSATARIDLGGSGRRPRFTGELRVRDGAFDPEALGFRLDDLQVELGFLGDSVALRRFSVRGQSGAARGGATLGGAIRLRDTLPPAFDLRLRAARMPLVAVQRRADLTLDGELRLAGAYDGATLDGGVTVTRGVVRLPRLSGHDVVGNEDSAFVRLVDSLTERGRATAEGPGPGRRFLDRLAVRDLEIRLGDDVWLRSEEANLSIGGAVRVTKAAARSARDSAAVGLRGELRLVRGRYTMDLGAIQRTFDLENGTLRFDGDSGLNPVLDINALHVLVADPSQGRDQEVRIRAHIGGSLRSPTLALSSASGPDMSQEKLLSYLVTGQPNFEVGQGEAAKELARTELSGRVASNLASRLNGGGLFDMVTITPGGVPEDNTSGLGSQTLTSLMHSRFGVGKKLNDRTFLTVDAGGCALTGSSETSLTESLGLSLDYRFRPDRTLSLRSEPPTSATYCSGSLPRGFALEPRQWGIEATRRWRF